MILSHFHHHHYYHYHHCCDGLYEYRVNKIKMETTKQNIYYQLSLVHDYVKICAL